MNKATDHKEVLLVGKELVAAKDDLASPITAVDVVELVRGYLIEEPRGCAIGSLTHKVSKVINFYDKCVTANAIDVDNLTQEKSSDKELQKVAHDYGMTMNQVVAFMDMCEQVNSNMGGTGVIAVPFWFHEQYVNLQKQNQALIQQTDSLMATLSVVEKKIASGQSTIEDLGLQMPQRKNIITGVTTPYIAGVTGARLGDEHLDAEHIYVPPHSGRR